MEINKNKICAVVGSRDFANYKLLTKVLNLFKPSHIISGGVKGADTLAARYAKERNIELTEILPDWDKYGNSAGFIRNKDIVEQSEVTIAFWDGLSKGTGHTINLSNQANHLTFYILYRCPQCKCPYPFHEGKCALRVYYNVEEYIGAK